MHLAIYRMFPDTGAVLHGHSPEAVGMSRAAADAGEWVFAGHEMLKVFPGNTTHEAEIRLPIVDNSQDMAVIEKRSVRRCWRRTPRPPISSAATGSMPGARTAAEAERVLEGTEWLIAAELAERAWKR